MSMGQLSPLGGGKTVAASGTAEKIAATATKVLFVVFRAKTGNTNNVYLGDSNVDKTTSPQLTLTAGQTLTVNAPTGFHIDLTEWYVDADTNGEGVDFLTFG